MFLKALAEIYTMQCFAPFEIQNRKLGKKEPGQNNPEKVKITSFPNLIFFVKNSHLNCWIFCWFLKKIPEFCWFLLNVDQFFFGIFPKCSNLGKIQNCCIGHLHKSKANLHVKSSLACKQMNLHVINTGKKTKMTCNRTAKGRAHRWWSSPKRSAWGSASWRTPPAASRGRSPSRPCGSAYVFF